MTRFVKREHSKRGLSGCKKTSVAFALVFSIGLHWPLLQSVAWLNMIVCFAKEEGIQRAVIKTFGGQHPCKLCKFVRAGQKAEKESSQQQTFQKIDLVTFAVPRLYFGQLSFLEYAEPGFLPDYPATAPPVPPPDCV